MRLAIPLLLAACGVRDDGDPVDRIGDVPDGGDGGTVEPAEPSVTIVAPADTSGVYGTTTLRWEVENFTLDGAGMGLEDVEGRGHVHYYLDGVLQSESADTELPIALATGEHTLEVRLARNDHEELEYTDWVWVETLNPTITLTPPWNAAALPGSSADVEIAITEFEMDASEAVADFGEGYYAIYVDGVLTNIGTDPLVAPVTRIPEGPHTVRAELLHADGSPLVPPVTSNVIDVNVVAGAPYVAMDPTPFTGEVPSASAIVDVTTTNFALGPGDGSYHVYVDGAYFTDAWEPSFLLTHLSAGRHLVEVRLADGGEIGVRDVMPIVVAEARPDVDITYPGDSWGLSDGFELSFYTENFELNPTWPSANVEGQGHVQIYVDDVLFASTASATAPMTGLAAGERRIRVVLVNNDETPLDPPVLDQIRVDVE
ncbi:MAG: hypothetical protein ACOZNI_19705 [Myxococcota bacterium]